MPGEEGEHRFDYASYFARIKSLERLSLKADEIAWREKYEAPARPVDVLLYLGCNILITSHLAMEVVAVLRKLDIDFEAIGGPQFCCGIVHHSHGDIDAAGRLSSATVRKMESYGAKTMVMWCPSCDLQFDEVVLPSLGRSFTPDITHATQFLAERVNEIPFQYPVRSRIAVHSHVGHGRQERDTQATLSLLRAVPGVDVMGTISSRDLGYHCPTPPSADARRAFLAERNRLLDEARALGADTVVTMYHSCQREWCDADSEQLRIRNYISIIAESLGCAAEDRYTKLRQSPDATAIAAASEPQWTSHGWSAEKATNAAASLLHDKPPTNVPANEERN